MTTLQGATMTENLPTQFRELGVKELRRSALEDFAVGIELTDNKETVLAALAEAGVTWKDYMLQHPEVVPVAPEPVMAANVITNPAAADPAHNVVGAPVDDPALEVVLPVEPAPIIHTAAPVVAAPADKYLVKMIRENHMFQTRGYTFTQTHPYALVNGADLEYILSKEDGFRQALPSELQEFYG